MFGLDDLLDGCAEAIGNYFRSYFEGIDAIRMLSEAAPSQAIDGFPSVALWNASTDMALSIGMGVASTLVALFMFFELASLFNRSDTKGWDGIYWIAMVFLKVAIMMAVCRNMTTIIGAVFEVSTAVVNNITQSDLFQNTVINGSDVIANAITESFQETGNFWTILGGYVVGFFSKLASGLAMILAELVCKLRFIEIYVFTAVAPIAFSTFVSRDYKSIAINYIKRMLALGLQGAFITIVCVLYVAIVNAALQMNTPGAGAPLTTDQAFSAMFQMIGYSLLLVIAIFQTSGWSKGLLQVN